MSERSSNGKRVLVVDDERHITRLLQINLERAGHDVAIAYDGVEATESLSVEEAMVPDAIVLDQLMPRMDGFEVLQWLEENGLGGIPVMLMTTEEHLEFTGPSGGELLTKPFNPRVVVEWVGRVTSGPMVA